MPHLNNTASCHFRVSMHQYNYSNIFMSIRGSPSPTGRAHARHPRTTFSSLLPMKKYSCPFVSIRGSYLSVISCLSCISCFSWLNTPSAPSCPFVFIRGSYLSPHSWFIFSPSLRVHSWPRRTTSAIKEQTGHPRKIIKKVYISACYSKTSFPYGTSWSP